MNPSAYKIIKKTYSGREHNPWHINEIHHVPKHHTRSDPVYRFKPLEKLFEIHCPQSFNFSHISHKKLIFSKPKVQGYPTDHEKILKPKNQYHLSGSKKLFTCPSSGSPNSSTRALMPWNRIEQTPIPV